MYIIAGANRMLGNIPESNKILEQIIYGSKDAQGAILWFINKAKDMRYEEIESTDGSEEDNYEKEEDSDGEISYE